MNRRLSLVLALVAASLAAPAIASLCGTPASMMAPPSPTPTHIAVASGNWDLTTTWSTGTVPGNDAVVKIPAGFEVRVRTQETARLRFIQVDGTLRFAIQNNTRLLVDTIVIDHFDPLTNDGRFVIGDPVNTVYADKTAEIVFISWDGNPIDLVADPEELGRGLIAMGKVEVYGAPKTHMTTVSANALKTATTVDVDTEPSGWRSGDDIVLTGSFFRRVAGETSSQDEVRSLSSVSGTGPYQVTLGSALTNDHIIPSAGNHLHLANLTRNVIFRSESTEETWERGHIMLMDELVDIRNAAMIGLGRTDKRIPLDDFIVSIAEDMQTPPVAFDYSLMPNPYPPENRRGRYSLHFHLNGTWPNSPAPSKVYNSVVRGAIGWAFVSHSSHVDFDSNVAHDFYGAGFITEMGDELGNFTNNIAIRGKGDGEYRPVKIVFENTERRQPLGDFGFSGDGFWFQGPAIRANNNVAAGCDGAGMMWFTTGAPKFNDRYESSPGSNRCHPRYSHFPSASVSTVYSGFTSPGTFAPRHWGSDPTKLVIADLPILECDGFEAYGNLTGFRLRFNNHDALAWYGEPPYYFDSQITGTVDENDLYTQEVKNLKLWNNEGGFSMRYAANTDWDTVDVVNRLDYTLNTANANPNTNSTWVGGEMFHAILNSSFTDLTIDGYEVASRIEANGSLTSRTEIGFPFPGPTFLNYALFDTMIPDSTLACPQPSVTVSAPTCPVGTTRSIHVATNAAHHRYMLRYRPSTAQQWTYLTATPTPTTTTFSLTGLVAGTTYTYQVVGACDAVVNNPPTTEHALTSYYSGATNFAQVTPPPPICLP
jgi:hypothetical protein